MTLADSPVSSPDTSFSLDPESIHQWDINDNLLPTIMECETYNSWPNGHSKAVYCEEVSEEARRHASGWAMRNTNNHKVEILKKSCLGVLVCNERCVLESADTVHMRPAICDKARRKQLGRSCPNPRCQGRLELRACRGHCGYPVTHFWRHVHGRVFFQAKGVHDHPAPDLKTSVDGRRNNPRSPGHYERQRGVTRKRMASRDIVYSNKMPYLDFSQTNLVSKATTCACGPYDCQCGHAHQHVNHAHQQQQQQQQHEFAVILHPPPYIQLDDLNYSLPPQQQPPRSVFDRSTVECSAYSAASSSPSSTSASSPSSASSLIASPPETEFDINESFKAACAEFTSGFMCDLDMVSPPIDKLDQHDDDDEGEEESLSSCMYVTDSGGATLTPSFDKFADTDSPLYGATVASTFKVSDFLDAGLPPTSVSSLLLQTDTASSEHQHHADSLSLNLPAITSFLDDDILGSDDVTDDAVTWDIGRADETETYSALLQASNQSAFSCAEFTPDLRELVPGFT